MRWMVCCLAGLALFLFALVQGGSGAPERRRAQAMLAGHVSSCRDCHQGTGEAAHFTVHWTAPSRRYFSLPWQQG